MLEGREGGDSQQMHKALSIIGVGVLGIGTRKVGPKAFAGVASLTPSPPYKLQSRCASIYSKYALCCGVYLCKWRESRWPWGSATALLPKSVSLLMQPSRQS